MDSANKLNEMTAARLLPSQQIESVRQRNAIQIAFRWRADDGMFLVIYC